MKIIIMAGGSGTRLWPLSRANYPKQFLKLKGMKQSIFQLTMNRCLMLAALNDIYIVTNKNYKFLISGQIEEMGLTACMDNILLEPQPKNTLPAIYNGVKTIQKNGEDIVAVFPSDHLIGDAEQFAKLILSGISFMGNHLLTFGICAASPETGYGYIKPGKKLLSGYLVDQFKEKPDIETAQKYVKEGYYWNSGMFMFRTDLFVEEVRMYCPAVFNAFQNDSVDKRFEATPGISIDYGLMEKSERVAVVPMDIKWNDLGSFATFYDEYNAQKDNSGNVLFDGEIAIESSDNMVYTDEDKAVAIVGVDDLVVVDQRDALLICHKDKTQNVKDVVDRLKQTGDKRADYHLTEYRPWGSFTVLEEGMFYKIKHLTILPGKMLSYQMHYHRSEHWIIVNGTATITIDGSEKMVFSNESIFIKSGCKHRLANNGKILLEVIEVQSGSYLNEDDIVRFEDAFGRN